MLIYKVILSNFVGEAHETSSNDLLSGFFCEAYIWEGLRKNKKSKYPLICYPTEVIPGRVQRWFYHERAIHNHQRSV